VADELLDYDVIICSEDIKMADDLGVARAAGELVIKDVVVPFIQIWSSGSLVGVNAGWARDRMGLDHDGDAVRLVDCNDKPLLWSAVFELPPGETPKLAKSKRPLDKGDLRADMIFKSMTNLVGFATNVCGATYIVKDREWLAAELYCQDKTGVPGLDQKDHPADRPGDDLRQHHCYIWGFSENLVRQH